MIMYSPANLHKREQIIKLMGTAYKNTFEVFTNGVLEFKIQDEILLIIIT